MTKYAHDELFLPVAKKSCQLTHETDDEGNFWCWPFNEEKSLNNVVKIVQGERCSCMYRKTYMIQCAHELLNDGSFKAERYHSKWYNDHYYKDRFESSVSQTNLSNDFDNEDFGISDHENSNYITVVDNSTADVSESIEKVNVDYGDLRRVAVILYVMFKEIKRRLKMCI